MRLFNKIGAAVFQKRFEKLESFINEPHLSQQNIFNYLTAEAKKTTWGKAHHYASIRNYQDYKNRVPIQTYEDVKPYIDRIIKGEKNLLWKGEIKWFAKSSGTTSDKSKFIPVTKEALEETHFKGGKDILSIYTNNYPETELFRGKGLVLGGSHQINQLNKASYYGDVSAVILKNLPLWSHVIKTPDLSTALLSDWEEKIDKMARITMDQNVTNLVGVPTWTVVLIKKILELSGKEHLLEVWPDLELYVHGGVSFSPYLEQFKQFIPSNSMHYLETYNASEGFFAIQFDKIADDMLLLLDHGIFYEFLPMDELDSNNPKTLQLDEVEIGKNYALVISTNAGLWRYLIGDTIRFTSLFPYKIQITGRTKSFINAFGEELIVENAVTALTEACKETNAIVKDYTAAPIYFSDKENARHEWIIEFEKAPENMESFTIILDQKLQEVNSDYEAKRFKDMALTLPVIHNVPKGTFYNWMKVRGKLGGQNKVPPLSNDRKYVEDILSMPQL